MVAIRSAWTRRRSLQAIALTLFVAIIVPSDEVHENFVGGQKTHVAPSLAALQAAKKSATAAAEPLEPPKRPVSSYMLWLNENRDAIKKKLPADDQAKVTEVSKAAGAEWKKLAAKSKEKYEKKAATMKEEYQKALEEFKANGGVLPKRTRKSKDADGKEVKAKKEKDPNAPKRPLNAYLLFSNKKRADVQKSLPKDTKYTEVIKELGRQWSEMSDKQKAPFTKEAGKFKEKYEEELKAYKR